MRILSIILVAAIVGVVVGGGAAYIEVRSDPDSTTPLPLEAGATPIPLGEDLPRAQVDEPNFNFDKMQRGTTKSHEFVIKNVGTAPLTLRIGSTTCKCTLGDVSGKPIPPGESTKVRLEWSAKSDNGPFRQSATIITNDPRQSSLDLTVEGEIFAASFVEPHDLMFDKLSYGETKTAQVYVMAMLQDDLTVSDPVFSNPDTRDKFDVLIEPVENSALPNQKARRGVRITVTAKAGLPIGNFSQWLGVKTNLPEAEKLEIPVAGRVVGDISVRGNGWNDENGSLNLGSVSSSEGKKARLNVIVRGPDAAGVKFAVQSVDPPEMKVTVGEPKKVKENLFHAPLDIEVPAGTRPMVRLDTAQGDAARIVLSTTHPKIKDLSVGVRFAVER